jgi:uncharacterized membrane protein
MEREPERPAPQRDDPTIERNVRVVAELEHQALGDRSLGQRIGDAAARTIGSMPFLVFQVAFIGGWVAINVGAVPGVTPFDPFPFALLALVGALEAIFLTLFVLISQNRMSRQADKRAHLDLQINLLAEAETTKILRVLDRIADRVGVPKEEEPASDLHEETDILRLADRVESKIPESSG